jgi:hypothetical protein
MPLFTCHEHGGSILQSILNREIRWTTSGIRLDFARRRRCFSVFISEARFVYTSPDCLVLPHCAPDIAICNCGLFSTLDI